MPPDASHHPADVVNLGDVVNVIEGNGERRDALIAAVDATRPGTVSREECFKGRLDSPSTFILTSALTFKKPE
jgi:hypothetical protein